MLRVVSWVFWIALLAGVQTMHVANVSESLKKHRSIEAAFATPSQILLLFESLIVVPAAICQSIPTMMHTRALLENDPGHAAHYYEHRAPDRDREQVLPYQYLPIGSTMMLSKLFSMDSTLVR